MAPDSLAHVLAGHARIVRPALAARGGRARWTAPPKARLAQEWSGTINAARIQGFMVKPFDPDQVVAGAKAALAAPS